MTEIERLDGIIAAINACIATNEATAEEDAAGCEDELAAYVDGLRAALAIVERAANKLR